MITFLFDAYEHVLCTDMVLRMVGAKRGRVLLVKYTVMNLCFCGLILYRFILLLNRVQMKFLIW
jgi:hypothetical protein